jgi:SAM-dependent methyltransferase
MTIQPKEFFIEKVAEELGISEQTRVIDLGSGQSRNFVSLLQRFPKLTYVGVEPKKEDAEMARVLLKKFPNVKIYNQLAYEPLPDEASFDICLSFSVLEHVKQIERFLENSVRITKQLGYIIHRYDLGHALYPSNLKERFQVFLGNKLPFLLSEHKFVRYLDPEFVQKTLERYGAQVAKITYHQMPNHKRFLHTFLADSEEKKILAKHILQWEFDISPYLMEMNKKTRELLFPSVVLWARKK